MLFETASFLFAPHAYSFFGTTLQKRRTLLSKSLSSFPSSPKKVYGTHRNKWLYELASSIQSAYGHITSATRHRKSVLVSRSPFRCLSIQYPYAECDMKRVVISRFFKGKIIVLFCSLKQYFANWQTDNFPGIFYNWSFKFSVVSFKCLQNCCIKNVSLVNHAVGTKSCKGTSKERQALQYYVIFHMVDSGLLHIPNRRRHFVKIFPHGWATKV